MDYFVIVHVDIVLFRPKTIYLINLHPALFYRKREGSDNNNKMVVRGHGVGEHLTLTFQELWCSTALFDYHHYHNEIIDLSWLTDIYKEVPWAGNGLTHCLLGHVAVISNV